MDGGRESEDSLFRKQALNALGQRRYGRALANFPRSWVMFALAMAVFFVLLALFLANITYARKETVTGWLVPDAGLIRLGSPQAGSISKVMVEEGETVAEGQPLMFLSFDSTLQGGQMAAKEMLAQLEQEERALNNLRDQTIGLGSLSKGSLSESLVRRREQISLVSLQISEQRKRLALANDIVARLEILAEQDAAAFIEIARARSDAINQAQELINLEERLGVLRREAQELDARIEQLPFDTSRASVELDLRLAELAQRRTGVARQSEIVISAPTNGTVSTLQAERGGAIDLQAPLVTLLPEGSKLYAQVYIPSRAIGFVEPGQKVRIFYEAFPYESFGSASGEVSSVSTSVLQQSEIPSAVAIEGAAYKVQIRLESFEMNAIGKQFPLKPGMALSAEIILERRTLLQFLFDPIFARTGRLGASQ